MNKIATFLLVIVMLSGAPARAADKFLDIQEVKSKNGITAWLVEDHNLPVIAVRFAFQDSGSILETPDKQGIAQLLSNTMDEGAGDLDSTAFQKALLDHSITLRFNSGRDSFGGRLKTLTANKDEAFRLLKLAISEPRFDEEPVIRMRDSNLARIRSSLSDPDWMAARLSNDRAFEGHPYAMNAGGTLTTMAKLTPNDLDTFYRTHLTRDRLLVAVTGDITAAELSEKLDDLFGALPERGADRGANPLQIRNAGTTALFKRPIPQTIIAIVMPSIGRTDKDYYALQVLNYIFGGAGFGSRLMEEVRENRGLTYGIYSSMRNYRQGDALAISLSTSNETTAQALDVIREQMNRLINEPVSEQELADAKSYLTGSMPLALSSTEAIAGILLSLQQDSLPIDYLDGYATRINAVTVADIQRVAVRLFNEHEMTVAMVGNPADIEPTLIVETLPNAE